MKLDSDPNHLRILVVTHDYPPPAAGGYGVMAADVCQMLVDRGHEVDVLTAANGMERGPDVVGPHVHRVLRTYYENGECVFPPLEAAADIERHNIAALDRHLQGRRPDVVSFWHMGAMSLNMITFAANRGFPLVFVIGDDWIVYGAWADGWQRRFLDDYEPERAEQVARETGLPTTPPDVWRLGPLCFVSEYTRSRASAGASDVLERTSVVHPGLSDIFFTRSAPSFEWNDQLLWVGRLIESKGILTTLRAMTELPARVRLRILGVVDGDFLPTVQHEIERLGLGERVSIGWVERPQLPEEYARACVTLFTSEIEHEAFGLVAAEAMACGSLVVSSAVGGNAELCHAEVNCLTYPAGDASALAAQVRRLADDADLRARLGTAALETARQLTLARQVDALERVFVSALDDRR